MNKLKGIMQKRRHLFVKEADVIGVLIILDDIKQNNVFHKGLKMEIGKCGGEGNDTWLIECVFTNKLWRKFIEALNDYDYNLVLSPYEYYYVKEKVEGQK